MGREVRMVPPNWEHPKREDNKSYHPIFDRTYKQELDEWLQNFDRIRKNGPSEGDYYETFEEWLCDNPPPSSIDYYRPYEDSEATWVQVYETVSEGTPVTPPFATKKELVDYLVNHGDFWQQRRWREKNDPLEKRRNALIGQPEKPGYGREYAERFVESGWVPTGIMTTKKDGSVDIKMGIESA